MIGIGIIGMCDWRSGSTFQMFTSCWLWNGISACARMNSLVRTCVEIGMMVYESSSAPPFPPARSNLAVPMDYTQFERCLLCRVFIHFN